MCSRYFYLTFLVILNSRSELFFEKVHGCSFIITFFGVACEVESKKQRAHKLRHDKEKTILNVTLEVRVPTR